MTALKAWIRALDYTRKSRHLTLPTLIDDLAAKHGDRPALLDDKDSLTYRDLADKVNRIARWAVDTHLAGQAVSLLMHNCPDYVAIWLGLTRVGCTVALLNTNLRGDALAHCIDAAAADTIIVSTTLLASLGEERGAGIRFHEWAALDEEISGFSPSPIAEIAPPSPRDMALLIYTSGTTGLPKAANITHARIIEWSFWFAGMMNARPDDCLYDCLPMYHSVGGVVAIGSMLVSGGSVVIRERFSASRFWDDVTHYRCTIFQYIGELCRYLTSAAPVAIERDHRLRLAVGNGLQADVWRTFQDRFAIPQILEFYAATEGGVSLYNGEGEPGSIGRIPPFLEPHFAVKLIKVDPDTGVPLRDASGFCIVSDVDEPGEAVGLITGHRAFDGYNDPEASKRKIIDNVFAEGDRWFRTGDLMRKNAAGFFFFVDRLGDTFRWKGENVSTTEVANILRLCPGVSDSVVFGVEVEGNEGRAGMAALTTSAEFSFETLAAHVRSHLPAYARPMFLRIAKSLDVTDTFKLIKHRLAVEGYKSSNDPVWVYEQHAERFVPYGAA